MEKLEATAIKLLARRDHSVYELRQKLQRRGFSVENITDVLKKLTAKQLLDDQRFAENYKRMRVNKGYGALRIAAELQQRGVNAEIIAQCLTEEKDWLQHGLQLYQKRFGKKIPKDKLEQARQMRFLQYRGFTSEQIRKIFDVIKVIIHEC